MVIIRVGAIVLRVIIHLAPQSLSVFDELQRQRHGVGSKLGREVPSL